MVHLLLGRLETWTVSFMSLLCVSAKEFRTDCSRDWFGPNCQFKCRCSTGCSDTGECTSKGVCMNGYFGHLCQYRDLTNELDQKDREITDNNDMTCLKDGRESVTLLMSPGPFSFFRAIVNRSDPEKVDSISFELTTDLNTSMTCGKDGRAYKTEPFIKYFHCPTQVSVSHLVLKGSGVPYLCTVNIGGGRNLALKENYTYSSVYAAVTGAGGNDGEIPTNGLFSPATCFHASWTSLISFYQINFHVPVLINYFVVMSRPETVYSSRMNHFELLTYAEDNNTVMHYTEPTDEDKPGSLVYKVTHTGNNVPIRSFRLQKNHSSIVIQFCEVEAYGDCPPGIQELDCEEECSVKCANQKCEASGRCIDCPPGFYGDQCESECLFGTYGPGCKEQCVNCSNDNCDKMTGDCDMCKDGHWDKDCKKVCPPNCVFHVCDQLTSECSDGCTAGYFGPYCEFECQPGYFGPNCMSPCSRSCPKSCDRMEGQCLIMQCPKGTYGEICENNCDKNCLNSECFKENGSCVACVQGFYYADCSEECHTNCRSNTTCHQVEGTCPDGCMTGYFGDKCTIECSKTCGGSGSCDSIDGHCSEGCKTGFYGFDCLQACSSNCVGGATCDEKTGSCLRGCQDGFFGPDCKVVCPVNCGGNKSCDLKTQRCTQGCNFGYGGDTCNKSCSHCMEELCDQRSLTCRRGCKEGVAAIGCTAAASKSANTDESNSSSFYIVIPLFLIIAVAALLALLWKKKPSPITALE